MTTSRYLVKALLSVLLLAAVGCDDAVAPAEADFRAVRLSLNATELDVIEGEPRTLKATLYDAGDRPVDLRSGEYTFQWIAANPTLLQIDESGSEAVLRFRGRGNTQVSVTARRVLRSSVVSMAVVSDDSEPLTGSAKVRSNQKPAKIQQAGGNGQKGRVKTVLPDSLAVRIVDRQGNGVAGQSVTFRVVSGGGSPSPTEAVTDDSGYARTTWTLGEESGTQQIEATTTSKIGTATFEAEATPSSPASLVVTAGDLQSGVAGKALANRLVVMVADEFGNEISNAAVSWSVSSGGGSLGSIVSPTGNDGLSSAAWTLGTTVGEQRVVASIGSLNASFTATATAASTAISSVAISPRSITLDALGANGQFSATVKDELGATVSGTTVSWTSRNTAVVTVDGTGKVTAKTVGTALIIAAVAGITDSASVTVRQVPASVTLSSSSLSMVVGESSQLTATIKDAGGSTIPNAPISWSTSASSIATVSSSGLVGAVAQGNASITATSGSAKASASVAVTALTTTTQPVVSSAGIWIGASELASLPTTGTAWDNVKRAADSNLRGGVLTLRDNNNTRVMAAALVAARLNSDAYRARVRDALLDVMAATIDPSDGLAANRRLGTYAIAADLIGLGTFDPTTDTAFRRWLVVARDTKYTNGGGGTIPSYHERRPNNYGTHAGFSRMAVALYLGNRTDFERAVTVFRGWLGERSFYSGFSYGSDLTWQNDSKAPVGINPRSATKDGHTVDGVLADDQRRCGSFQWPVCTTNYTWEAMQGALAMAWVAHRQGYDAFNWSDKALLRASNWMYNVAAFPATGDDTWQLYVLNRMYGVNLAAPSTTSPGKNVGWTEWTHR